MFAYVGCYTTPDRDGRGDGLNVYRMDPASGQWTPSSSKSSQVSQTAVQARRCLE